MKSIVTALMTALTVMAFATSVDARPFHYRDITTTTNGQICHFGEDQNVWRCVNSLWAVW